MTTVAPITASTNVSFGQGSGPAIKIVGDPTLATFTDFGIPLRCYPPGCKLVPSIGSIVLDAVYEVVIQGSMLHWNGQSAKLPFLPSVGTLPPTIELVYGFNPVTGDLIGGAAFKYNPAIGEFTSNVLFEGLVKIGTYKSQYQRFWYKPAFTTANINGVGLVQVAEQVGSIGAYKQGTFVIFDVPMPSLNDMDRKIEIYRVVSQTVITTDGEWELPETWNSSYTGNYNDGKTGPDKDISAVKERVHEIGYCTIGFGETTYERFSHGLKQPYPGNLIRAPGTVDFQPVVSIRSPSLQQLNQLFTDSYPLGQAQYAIGQRNKQPLIP